MSQEGPGDLDRVFKALGNVTRRRILQLLTQRAHYPYELSTMLGLTPRGVFKHLESLQKAGLVEREHGESELGPDRVYYRLNVRFGLSTTILPDAFAVRLTRHGRTGRLIIPQGFVVPEARPDVTAVKRLLRELGKVNGRLSDLDQERMRFASLRGQIIRQIESIMEEAKWDEESCQKVRTLLDPVRQQMDESKEEEANAWTSTVQEAVSLFERMFSGQHPRLKKKATDQEEEFVVDLE
ncbi:MAG: ArsR/SmtB family transcription factor [Candidatus Thorarchaeota archaeon]|jgi:predicted transcriptional regulator